MAMRLRTGLIVVTVLVGLTCAQADTHTRKAKAKTLAPLPSYVPAGPLPQIPLDQLPATAPQVSYQNGLLTIVAHNSTLADILREVHKRTGAVIETSTGGNERVAVQLGPGPARDVMASLLNGTNFNYMVVGTASDPNALAQVILLPKGAAPAGARPATPGQPVYPAPQPRFIPPQNGNPGAPGVQPGQPEGDDNAAPDDTQNPDDQAEQQDQEQQPENPENPGAQEIPPPQAGTQPFQPPKSPEQILQQLRDQNQPGQPPQPPPR